MSEKTSKIIIRDGFCFTKKRATRTHFTITHAKYGAVEIRQYFTRHMQNIGSMSQDIEDKIHIKE